MDTPKTIDLTTPASSAGKPVATAGRSQAEMVYTLRADGKPGEQIPKDEYDNWSYFILSTLAKQEDLTCLLYTSPSPRD